MDTREQASALVRALGETLGISLTLDASGACGLRIDDRLELTLRLESHPPALLAYAPIGVLPTTNADAALRRLLAANHMWEGSQGSTWSLLDGQITLARLLPLEGLTAAQLAHELSRFADVACAEQDRLRTQPQNAMAHLPPGMLAA